MQFNMSNSQIYVAGSPAVGKNLFCPLLSEKTNSKYIRFNTLINNKNKFRVSDYIVEYKKNNVFAYYNYKTLQVVYGKKKLKRIMDEYKKPKNLKTYLAKSSTKNTTLKTILNTLIREEYLVSGTEGPILNNAKLEERNRINPNLLRILLTFDCNLECKYCQIRTNLFSEYNKPVTKEEIDKAFALFKKNNNEYNIISLSGGEPMLTFDLVKYVVEKSKKEFKPGKYHIVLSSNGTLITDCIAEYVAKKNLLPIISLDGQEKDNKMRIYHNGLESYKNILAGIETLKRHNCKNIAISMTIGAHNIKNIKKTMQNIINKINPVSVGYNFVHYPYFNNQHYSLPDINDYSKAVIHIFTELRKHKIYDEQFFRRLQPFVERKIRIKECSALGGALNLVPGGFIGPCKTLLASKHFSQPIDKTENLGGSKIFTAFSNRSTLTLDECKNCVARTICGGGCTFDSFVTYHDIFHVDKRNCEYIRKVLEFMIWDLYRLTSKKKTDVLIPTNKDRKKMYGGIKLLSTTLTESVGHKIY